MVLPLFHVLKYGYIYIYTLIRGTDVWVRALSWGVLITRLMSTHEL